MIDLYRKKVFSERSRSHDQGCGGGRPAGDQIDRGRRIVDVPAGEGVRDDHAGPVDTRMELLRAARMPRPPCFTAAHATSEYCSCPARVPMPAVSQCDAGLSPRAARDQSPA